jgi:hypothetical protein
MYLCMYRCLCLCTLIHFYISVCMYGKCIVHSVCMLVAQQTYGYISSIISRCAWVCMCTHVYVCVRMCVYTCRFVFVCSCIYGIYTCIHIGYTNILILIHIHIRVYMHIHIRIRIHIHIHLYVHVHVHIHVHTYIHACKHPSNFIQ